MNNGVRIGLILFGLVCAAAVGGGAWVTRSIAQDIVMHPVEERPKIKETPADYGMGYEDVAVTTSDGLDLCGWYLPGDNGGTVLIQHGSPGGRQDGLYEAAVLNRAGFNVMLGSFRAHDECDGERISFGRYEQLDLSAWHGYVKTRPEVDPNRIGLFGESMCGGTSIIYTATHSEIASLATASGFALTQEVVETFIAYENPDMPPWSIPLLARSIVLWTERIGDFEAADLDTEAFVEDVRPRPILIIHGGSDDKIGPESGRRLYAAAKKPKELLYMEEAGHVNFEEVNPEAYERALISFFEENLLGD